MATYGQIQTRVLANLIDTPTAVQNAVPVLVNQAAKFLQRLHNFSVMLAEAQFITNSNAANPHIIGQIPVNWKEPRGDPYFVMQIGEVAEMVWDKERMYSYRTTAPFDPNASGPPRSLLLGEASNDTVPDPDNPDYSNVALNLEVYPSPDGLSDWSTVPGGEYRIRIPYWGYLPDLVSNGDMNWFTLNAEEFLEEFATARGFMRNWDEPRALAWMAQAVGKQFDGTQEKTLGGWARVAITADKSARSAPARVLAMRRDYFAPRDQFRT